MASVWGWLRKLLRHRSEQVLVFPSMDCLWLVDGVGPTWDYLRPP